MTAESYPEGIIRGDIDTVKAAQKRIALRTELARECFRVIYFESFASPMLVLCCLRCATWRQSRHDLRIEFGFRVPVVRNNS